MEKVLYIVKKLIPKRLFKAIQPIYHYSLAVAGAIIYRFPSRKLVVIGVTGTKGKSTVTEILTAILEAEGHTVASLSTIKFRIAGTNERNLFKMTMPGRFFVQRFMRRAVTAGCTHLVLEMTSEGARQYRHKGISLDALIFTNLTPEHIESHGSFEKYKAAKLELAKAVAKSKKRPRYLVANVDDVHGQDFLNFSVEKVLPYKLSDLQHYSLHSDGITLVLNNITIRVPLVGKFNVYNSLAAITLTQALGVSLETIQVALKNLPTVKGRVEHFKTPEGSKKHVTVIVDYAHTPDSLRQLYEAFPDKAKVGVLGNTGGGRDTWKRPEMAHIAEQFCEHIFLTNEDPYDEDPKKIVNEMAKGVESKAKLTIIMDRRRAIAAAIEKVRPGGYVIVSGKGTDPYIMGPNNTKEVWSDAEVAQEELNRYAALHPAEKNGDDTI